ncbi:AN1-type zinc finger 2B [Pelobates cultripes]|uniref:AN1-type zinc finger 2B n=2 Tax=Pelobates cultripes TaxID=61616 RepID=A0AAD1SPP6_PELCU|nr:AN1-type zinc finger 2B [Pelobates cultripes]
MELPDLGKHCSESTCKRLDFLPLECDACGDVFCKDHLTYDQHKCSSAYKKNVQVPVCPLCSAPVPIKRGEMPDVAVGRHIDRNCNFDSSNRKKKIFTNKCLKPGCKKKELMKIECDLCHNNFCLSHRHPLDHDCKANSRPLSKSGHAALNRFVNASRQDKLTINTTESYKQCKSVKLQQQSSNLPASQASNVSNVDIQNGLSEDDALQKALQLSLLDAGMRDVLTLSSPEEDNNELTQALKASLEEYRNCRMKSVKATGK